MGWIQIVDGPPKGWWKGWWKGWKMCVFLLGSLILAVALWMSVSEILPRWFVIPVVLLFLILCLLTSTDTHAQKRWDTELNTYVDYDSGDSDSMSDCGD